MANVLARWKGRERPVAFAVLCLLIASGLTTSQPETSLAQTGGKPNILFILSDDMLPDDLRFMPKTQNLLADQGVTFKNAFVKRSLCCPSRATIFRGQYSHNHRGWVNVPPLGGFQRFRELGRERSTTATWLDAAGYDTILAGKYLNRYDDTTYVPRGWDRWNAYLGTYYGDTYRINENGSFKTYNRSRMHDTDLAGVTPPGFVDGRSLSPILSATPPATWRTAFSVEHRRSKEEYPYVRAIPNYDAVRTASHLYVEYETGEKELYNLSKDPYELTNRYASASSTLRSDLRARLNALRGCAGPECRRAENGG